MAGAVEELDAGPGHVGIGVRSRLRIVPELIVLAEDHQQRHERRAHAVIEGLLVLVVARSTVHVVE
jgi:hypothetical protein